MHYWKRGLAFLLSVSCILTCSIPQTATVYAATAEEVANAESVDGLIDEIGDITRYSQKADIEAARGAYNALTEDAKAEVKGLGKLESAERVIGLYADSSVEIADQARENGGIAIDKPDGVFVDPYSVDGYSPNGYAFDTISEIPDVDGDLNEVLSGAATFTIETWVKPQGKNGWSTIIGKGNNQICVRTESGTNLKLYVKDAAGWQNFEYDIPDGWLDNWHHLVFSAEASTVRTFCDDVELTNRNTATYGSILSQNDPLWIGRQDENSKADDGKYCYASVHIYKRALTAAEVSANYAAKGDLDFADYEAADVLCWYDADDFSAKFTEDMQEVVDAVKAIEALPATLTESDVDTVNAANAKYLALDADQEAKVPAETKEKLDEALKAVEQYKDIFTVTFDSNGGSDVASKDVYDGTAVEEPYAPTKDNHVFRGWNLEDKPYNFSTPVTKAITLIAQWESYESVAAKVDALIDGIGEIKDYSKKKDIDTARAAYDALTDEAKKLVKNVSALEKAERLIGYYENVTTLILDQKREDAAAEIAKVQGIVADTTSPNGYAFDTQFKVPEISGDLNTVLSGNTGFAMEVWVNPKTLAIGNTFIAKGNNQVSVKLANVNGKSVLEYCIYDGSWQALNVESGAFTANNWHHLVANYDGAKMELYVDGSLAGTKEVATTVRTSDNALGVGFVDGQAEYVLDGKMAAAHVYNRALTAEEVAANYVGNEKAMTAEDESVVCWYDADNFKANFTEDMQEVVDAVKAIEALPASPEESDVEAVDAANALYLALDDAQKKEVPGGTHDKLTAALDAVAKFKDKVKVTFDSDEGSTLEDVYVPSGEAVPEPAAPTKSGYVFIGWYLNGTKYNFSAPVTENITLIAGWESIADAAGSVDALIEKIGEIKDYSKKDDIETARTAYNALTDEAKKLVKNVSALEKAERLIGYYENAPKAILDQKRVKSSAGMEIENGVVEDADSPSGYAFDAISQIPDMGGDLNTVLSGQATFTIETWVKQTDNTSAMQTIIGKGDNQICVRKDDNDQTGKVFKLYVRDAAGWQNFEYTRPDDWFGNWHHLVFAAALGTVKAYCDGVELTNLQNQTYGSIQETDDPLWIGRQDANNTKRDGNNRYASVHIYKRALTAGEVAANYAAKGDLDFADYAAADVLCWYDADMYDAKFATDLAGVIVSIENMPDAESVTGDAIAQVNRTKAAFDALTDEDEAQVSEELKKKLNDALTKVASLKYTVTFKEDSDAEGTKVEVAGGKAVAEPDAPSKAGYVFKGWYLGDTKYNFNKAVIKDITLTAKWEEESKEPGKDDPSKDDPSKDDPSKDDPSKDDPSKDDPSKDDPSKDDPSKDDPSKDDPSKDDPSKDDPSKDDPSKNDPSKDDPVKDPVKDQVKDPVKDDPSKNDPSKDPAGETVKTDEVKVSKIKITGISKKIAAGKTVTLKAEVTPANVTNKSVTWKSSNTKYATVDANGKVSVKKAGANKSVTITAEAADGSGKKASYKISIMKNAVKKIKLKANKKTVKANKAVKVKAGKKLTLKATVTPSKKVNKTLKWTSSNTKYATVSKKGVVTTKKAGKGKTVKITAKATDGSNKKITVKVKITK